MPAARRQPEIGTPVFESRNRCGSSIAVLKARRWSGRRRECPWSVDIARRVARPRAPLCAGTNTPATAPRGAQHANCEPGDQACDELADGPPQAAGLAALPRLPSAWRSSCFWPTRKWTGQRLLLPRYAPGSASFELSPDNADSLDSLGASCVLYLLSHRLSVWGGSHVAREPEEHLVAATGLGSAHGGFRGAACGGRPSG